MSEPDRTTQIYQLSEAAAAAARHVADAAVSLSKAMAIATEALHTLRARQEVAASPSAGQLSDTRPHSRACGIIPHEHGRQCHRNCPTCHGGDLDD